MYEVLLNCGLEAGDPRTVGVLEDMRRAGFWPKKWVAKAVGNRFAKRAVWEEMGRIFGEEGEEGGNGDEGNDSIKELEDASRSRFRR